MLTVAGVAGFALVGLLIVRSGAGEVAQAMLTLGWRLAPITVFHLIPLFIGALSWRELLPASSRLNIASAAWIRWLRESINNLLPVASIGGDVASVRLAHLHGVGTPQAAASVVVDTTVGVVTQLVFVSTGVTLLMLRSTDGAALLAARVRADRHRRLRRGDDDLRVASTSKHASGFDRARPSLGPGELAAHALGASLGDRR